MMNAMWRHAMFFLCLIAALSGAPLRHAEAANDFIRSVGEVGHGDLIETIDGGVGDDVEASVLKADGGTHWLTATNLPATVGVYFTPRIPVSCVLDIGNSRRADLLGSLAACSLQRSAWLQCFLF
jgi:hypothetical protein